MAFEHAAARGDRRCKKALNRRPFLRFAHRLALQLGIADVDALLASLPAGQLWRWMAFDELEPFGEIRADFRAGIIAASNTNLHLPKGRKALSPLDFMPFLNRDEAEPAALPSSSPREHVEHGLMALLSGAGVRAEAVRADLEKHHG